MHRITRIVAREVLDSRGQPTVEADVLCSGDVMGRAIVPSGASTGRAEAHELRDEDPARHDGRGVLRAVSVINDVLSQVLMGSDPAEQFAIDRRLIEIDGSRHKSRLGANSLLAVSLGVAHAAAAAKRTPLYWHINELWRAQLAQDAASESPAPAGCEPATYPAMPAPMTNMISGGLHAGGNFDFQDFMMIPAAAPRYSIGLEWLVKVTRRLSRLLTEAGHEGRLLADEGGFGPRLSNSREALTFLVRAIEAAGLLPGDEVTIALDVAASHFHDGAQYRLAESDGPLDSLQLVELVEQLVREFPIASVEDPLAEEDWDGWRELTRRLGGRVKVVGDDLLATNVERLRRAVKLQAANSVLVKPNQVGTLSETLAFMSLAHRSHMTRIVSARSGETEDTTIADLAVGTAAEMIKIGSIHHGERLAKYNRLLRIEQELAGG